MPLSIIVIALLETLLSLYFVVVIVRFWCQLLRLDLNNPLVRAVYLVTNPPLALLWKFIPALYGVDLAALLLILTLGLAKLMLELFLGSDSFTWSGALILSLARVLNTMAWVFIVAIMTYVIFAWAAPRSAHPVASLAYAFSARLTAPFQRVLPVLGGLDFSPVVAVLFLRFLQRILVTPLADWGARLLLAAT